MHLTNNAVQINSTNYGKFEDGNQLSFQDFQKYLDLNYDYAKVSVKNDIVGEMKKLVKLTFLSSREHFIKDFKSSSFEIFGFDFIIDGAFRTWLIEVNTNPCLEESSKLLESYIPRMIDDALKLTIDQIFKRKILTSSTEDSENKASALLKNRVSTISDSFPVSGYKDDENMWECLLSLS